jgi:hypothetical protein
MAKQAELLRLESTNRAPQFLITAVLAFAAPQSFRTPSKQPTRRCQIQSPLLARPKVMGATSTITARKAQYRFVCSKRLL